MFVQSAPTTGTALERLMACGLAQSSIETRTRKMGQRKPNQYAQLGSALRGPVITRNDRAEIQEALAQTCPQEDKHRHALRAKWIREIDNPATFTHAKPWTVNQPPKVRT
jgi:hypothetical protein